MPCRPPPAIDGAVARQLVHWQYTSAGGYFTCNRTNGTVALPADVCGVPGGNGTSCLDDCGVANGDDSSCATDDGFTDDGDDTFDLCTDMGAARAERRSRRWRRSRRLR